MRPKPYLSQQPVDDFGLGMPNHMYDGRLAASSALGMTVPGDSQRWKAVFAFTDAADVWVAVNSTATEPGAAPAALASTTSRLKPKCIEVIAGDTLSFISPTAGTAISVAFYAVGSNN